MINRGWQCGGQGFEPPQVHQLKSQPPCGFPAAGGFSIRDDPGLKSPKTTEKLHFSSQVAKVKFGEKGLGLFLKDPVGQI